MRGIVSILFALLIFPSTEVIHAAETVEFSDEELATETVLPRFEKTRVVLNRNVKTAGRFELGGGMGVVLNEPFYNPLQFNVTGTYHFNDLHAANVWAAFFMEGWANTGSSFVEVRGCREVLLMRPRPPPPR